MEIHWLNLTVELLSDVCTDKLIMNAYENAYEIFFKKQPTPKSLLLFTEMDASLVGAPDFKPECMALTLS